MSALALICATALSIDASMTIYPFPDTVSFSSSGVYQLSQPFVASDETKSFTFSVKSMSSECPSTVKLNARYAWRPISDQTITFDATVNKALVEGTEFTASPVAALRTVTVSMVTIAPGCEVTLDAGTQMYDNTFLEDAASLALGIVLAIIIGSIVVIICIIVCICYMCKKGAEGNTTTIIHQQAPVQSYPPTGINDGYNCK
eukprot:TRINITY_DN8424_c0_g1_i1.p1 TRINITY_DN8424_c0_g1~~TRINITY_DN8424_c0_g1_i1.p1  ORF type:complete len:202 (+),score=28.40 TRINITY_DN8424_c0_g1_i1:68-673(+)